jgi:hypothetical protein
MPMKTSELTGAALDWAVAKYEGYFDMGMASVHDGVADVFYFGEAWTPSTDWAQGGPIIEREGLTITHQQNQWAAQTDDDLFAFGPTPLIAAMRCYVASKQGEQMTTYSKNFIDSFVDAYSRNVACASDEAVRAFLQDYTDNMGWEQLNDRHEYGSNIIDALGMFEAGMAFKESNYANETV